MPLDRQRTFRELTFGKTLKYGLRDKKRNIFIDYNNLEKVQIPKYYIHLWLRSCLAFLPTQSSLSV